MAQLAVRAALVVAAALLLAAATISATAKQAATSLDQMGGPLVPERVNVTVSGAADLRIDLGLDDLELVPEHVTIQLVLPNGIDIGVQPRGPFRLDTSGRTLIEGGIVHTDGR